jgi:hypothetical protein
MLDVMYLLMHGRGVCRDARPFLEALDWMALGLLDYPFIVNMPMDLTTVETRLCDGFYRNAHAFARDVRLTFSTTPQKFAIGLGLLCMIVFELTLEKFVKIMR